VVERDVRKRAHALSMRDEEDDRKRNVVIRLGLLGLGQK
jgi:hypothetical protein